MLPYSAEALFALHGRLLEALWPFALPLALLTLLAAPALAFARRAWAARLLWGVVAAGWLWTGAVFHLGHFADFNFMAPVYAGLFLLQGGLLAWHGVVRNRLSGGWRGRRAAAPGALAVLFALAGYPVIDAMGGGPPGVRLAGLAPGPTVLLTLGLLALVGGRPPRHLLVVPLLAAGAAGLQGWVLRLPADVLAAALGLAALGTALLSRHRAQPGS